MRPGHPAIVLMANEVLIMLSGTIARVFMLEPILMHKDMDTMGTVVFAVVTALKFLSLVGNIDTFILDHRGR